MKVRITKCSGDYWYTDKIGQVYQVKKWKEVPDCYMVDDGNEHLMISKQDCEVL